MNKKILVFIFLILVGNSASAMQLTKASFLGDLNEVQTLIEL